MLEAAATLEPRVYSVFGGFHLVSTPDADVVARAEKHGTRIVVTDDRGRYVVPDLPRANYQVFVRGYGFQGGASRDDWARGLEAHRAAPHFLQHAKKTCPGSPTGSKGSGSKASATCCSWIRARSAARHAPTR